MNKLNLYMKVIRLIGVILLLVAMGWLMQTLEHRRLERVRLSARQDSIDWMSTHRVLAKSNRKR
ncbi:hypothetical protein EXU85_16365 [Spirosoma sp. KCTC 42546]|uniref:hypothetical protein n=1 Tax=Spirosoma sp. KCTC 42546 TaxID=2520506 RepID=UPI00115AE826|nr:hypothetical protein [Spirosoma sp. KCTC 42546]QDK80095.1 hypothetical protein EXU85_16365 [Spirosoma sp. KCTC 42546]